MPTALQLRTSKRSNCGRCDGLVMDLLDLWVRSGWFVICCVAVVEVLFVVIVIVPGLLGAFPRSPMRKSRIVGMALLLIHGSCWFIRSVFFEEWRCRRYLRSSFDDRALGSLGMG